MPVLGEGDSRRGVRYRSAANKLVDQSWPDPCPSEAGNGPLGLISEPWHSPLFTSDRDERGESLTADAMSAGGAFL